MPIKMRAIACFGVLTLAISGGVVGCSHADNAAPSETPPVPAVLFAVSSSSLPPCAKSSDGQIWYVWSSSHFYVCKGSSRTWTVTNINGYSAAVSIIALSAGTACPTGGVTLKFGLDVNRNGALDAAETTSMADLCNGAPGANGLSCWDLNGNGTCDVETEDKDGNGVCDSADCQGDDGTNGAPGVTGSAGLNSLVALSPELAGFNCASGGVRIQTGLDSNANGVLDPSEVTQTQYVCNGSPVSGAGGAPSTDGSTSTGGATASGGAAGGSGGAGTEAGASDLGGDSSQSGDAASDGGTSCLTESVYAVTFTRLVCNCIMHTSTYDCSTSDPMSLSVSVTQVAGQWTAIFPWPQAWLQLVSQRYPTSVPLNEDATGFSGNMSQKNAGSNAASSAYFRVDCATGMATLSANSDTFDQSGVFQCSGYKISYTRLNGGGSNAIGP